MQNHDFLWQLRLGNLEIDRLGCHLAMKMCENQGSYTQQKLNIQWHSYVLGSLTTNEKGEESGQTLMHLQVMDSKATHIKGRVWSCLTWTINTLRRSTETYLCRTSLPDTPIVCRYDEARVNGFIIATATDSIK